MLNFVSMLYLPIKSYFTHYFKSTSKFKIHSPFVFDFYSKVLNDSDVKESAIFEHRRQELKNNRSIIDVRDFGAGSHLNKSNKRSIRYISKTSLKSPKRCRMLYRLAKYQEANSILELGTSFGISTAYLSFANSNSMVHTIEGCPNIAKIASKTFEQVKSSNINLVVGNLDEKLSDTISQLPTLDLVLFDGNHQKQANLHYFEQCIQKVTAKSIFVFDDIRWSKEMESLWKELKHHPQVGLTIDLFDMGILFFKKTHQKEHFRFRY